MHHDTRIGQLSHDAVTEIALALTGPARQQHEVRLSQRGVQHLSQRDDIVPHDAAQLRLPTQLAHGVGEDLRVRVVHGGGAHRFTRRDDLVAG